MFAWLSENFASIIVLLILVGILTAIVMNMIKNKKAGKGSCSCGCEGCANKGSCHSAD